MVGTCRFLLPRQGECPGSADARQLAQRRDPDAAELRRLILSRRGGTPCRRQEQRTLQFRGRAEGLRDVQVELRLVQQRLWRGAGGTEAAQLASDRLTFINVRRESAAHIKKSERDSRIGWDTT